MDALLLDIKIEFIVDMSDDVNHGNQYELPVISAKNSLSVAIGGTRNEKYCR